MPSATAGNWTGDVAEAGLQLGAPRPHQWPQPIIGSIHSMSATRGGAASPRTARQCRLTSSTTAAICFATRRPRSGTPSASAMLLTSPCSAPSHIKPTRARFRCLHRVHRAVSVLLGGSTGVVREKEHTEGRQARLSGAQQHQWRRGTCMSATLCGTRLIIRTRLPSMMACPSRHRQDPCSNQHPRTALAWTQPDKAWPRRRDVINLCNRTQLPQHMYTAEAVHACASRGAGQKHHLHSGCPGVYGLPQLGLAHSAHSALVLRDDDCGRQLRQPGPPAPPHLPCSLPSLSQAKCPVSLVTRTREPRPTVFC